MRLPGAALPGAFLPAAWRIRGGAVLGVVVAGAAGVALAALVVQRPDQYRTLLAVGLVVILTVLGLRKPSAAALCVLLLLPLLALARRVLIADSGWTSYDPLLAISPTIALVLIYRQRVGGAGTARADTLQKLVAVLLGFTILQAFNPLAHGGVAQSIVGLMFVAAPLLWFFVGREVDDRRVVLTLLTGVIVVGVAVGAYGLMQTKITFPRWDQAWVDVTGYTSLRVGKTVRPFGTFSSAAEYAAFLGAALVICIAWMMHRRWRPVLALPLIAWPLFLVSGRGVVVLAVLAVIAMSAIRTGNRRGGLKVLAGGIVAVYAFAIVLGPALDRHSSSSGNDLTQHQVSGLLHPLDPNKSTAVGHWGLVVDGIREGFHQPLGQGTGKTNLASSKVGGGQKGNTEFDFSNAFVNLGLFGGVLFMVIAVKSFAGIIRRYAATRDMAVLAASGLLVVTLGQWLNGGYYAISALAWFLIGWASQPVSAAAAESAAPGAGPLRRLRFGRS
jgi:hypothetical protein